MKDNQPVIALLSDFGTREHYVGAMKGVIISTAPNARIVDISHRVTHYDVFEGSLTLGLAAQDFPPGTIFVGVIDPGVGGERRAIAARTEDGCWCVGPDNGLFTGVLDARGLESAWSLENKNYHRRGHPSTTFHGRDVFAPVAAHIANGITPESFGPRIENLIRVEPPPAELKGSQLVSTIQRIDEFGNMITGIPAALVEQLGARVGSGSMKVEIGGVEPLILPHCRTYSDAPKGGGLTLIDSLGFLSLAINQGSFGNQHGGRVHDPVTITWVN